MMGITPAAGMSQVSPGLMYRHFPDMNERFHGCKNPTELNV